jgi:hypothetical protein
MRHSFGGLRREGRLRTHRVHGLYPEGPVLGPFAAAHLVALLLSRTAAFNFRAVLLNGLVPLCTGVLLVGEFVQLEGFSVLFTHVLYLRQTLEVVDQVHHLFIVRVVVERNDRDAVVDLVSEAVDRVVNDNQVL